jgi:hypothetical protein
LEYTERANYRTVNAPENQSDYKQNSNHRKIGSQYRRQKLNFRQKTEPLMKEAGEI